MCNWFPSHVPSFQWQVIDNSALTKRSLCVFVYYVLTVWAALFEGQKLRHSPAVIYGSADFYNPPSSTRQSLMDLINYVNVTSAHWVSRTYGCFNSFAMQIWFEYGIKDARHALKKMHIRCRNSVNEVFDINTMLFSDEVHLDMSSEGLPWPLIERRKLFSWWQNRQWHSR